MTRNEFPPEPRTLKPAFSSDPSGDVAPVAALTSGPSLLTAAEVGLSLGSNLGDRRALLCEGRRRLLALPGVGVAVCSPLYETEPVGAQPQYMDRLFLNAVIVLEYTGRLDALAAAIHRIEAGMGRVRSSDRNAPRSLDIDLIYAGMCVIKTPTLTLPHPSWAARRFVAQPLADLRPGLRLPGADGTVSERLARLPDAPAVRRVADAW